MRKINPVVIELKPSQTVKGGVGLFAARAMKKDAVVIKATAFADETLISWTEFNKLDKVTKEKVKGFCCGTEEGFYAPKDFNLISIAWHMNHSCDPNIGFDSKYNFVAMKNIKKGDELFWDYCYYETNSRFKMACGCGAKNCRKIITGKDWKKAIEFKFNMTYISPHLKKTIKENKL